MVDDSKIALNVLSLVMTEESQPETRQPRHLTCGRPQVQARTVLVSMNPRAGTRARHEQTYRIVDRLKLAGYRAELTTDLETLGDAAFTLGKTGELRTVLAVGGDGTAAVVRTRVPLRYSTRYRTFGY